MRLSTYVASAKGNLKSSDYVAFHNSFLFVVASSKVTQGQ